MANERIRVPPARFRLLCWGESPAASAERNQGEVGLDSHANGVIDPVERLKLRAELDAMVAHLYGLSEAELTHILNTFSLVAQAQKDTVLAEYRRRAPHPDAALIAALIADGESERVEFKVAALWNPKSNQKDGSMRENVVQGVAAFLNSDE